MEHDIDPEIDMNEPKYWMREYDLRDDDEFWDVLVEKILENCTK